METDLYKTIEDAAETTTRERSSKFYAFAWPVKNEEEIKAHLDGLRKKYYDATHHCYAWRLGAAGDMTRANDDGEPSGTAGKPILGQILSAGLTDILIVVVRYFGGTKLGVPGLIAAYKEAAKEAIDCSRIVEKTINTEFTVRVPYEAMNGVMKVIKEMEPKVLSQEFDNVCEIRLSIRAGRAKELYARLKKCEGAEVEKI